MHETVYWLMSISVLCAANSNRLKPEQTVRRGPGSDPQCMSPLLSSLEEFPDSQFSASSVLENKTDFQPYQARLIKVYGNREHTSGYAWCPNSEVGVMLHEWIQAEFPHLVIIKSIFTAGRGDGNVREFMPSFVLKYQREDGGAWYEHTKRDGTKILKANSDPRNLARATLDSVVIAKRIRIYPYSLNRAQSVCLRFALYGCEFPDGVVSYSIPEGGQTTRSPMRRGGEHLDESIIPQLRDLFYDGQVIHTKNQLADGLGQLMDNVAYLGNLTRESDLYPAQPGFHFVGWHPADRADVQLMFNFDRVRQFTWLRMFTFDSIPLQVRLFSHATVEFSLDGAQFGNQIQFSTGRVQFYDSHAASSKPEPQIGQSKRGQGKVTADLRIYTHADYDGAVVVELPLNGQMGRYIRLSLTPTDNWIVLSEVQFNSTIVKGLPVASIATSKLDDEKAKPHPTIHPANPIEQKPTVVKHDFPEPNNSNDHKAGGAKPVDHSDEKGASQLTGTKISSSVDFETGTSKLAAVLPVIITTSVLLLLLPTVLLIWYCSRKHMKRTKYRCKVPLIDGIRGGPLPPTTGAFSHTQNAITADELAKLLGSYNTMPMNTHSEAMLTNGQFRSNQNGSHPSTMGQRLPDTAVPNPGILQNFPANQYLQNRHSAVLGSPLGATLACSPNASGSSSEEAPAVPGVSNLASTSPQANFVPETANIYSGTDTNFISPEYASASIFSYSPPPSESASNPPPTCIESMPPMDYRPNLPNYSLTHTSSGSGANFMTGSTLQNRNPNTIQRHPSGGGVTNPGLHFLPQMQFVGPRIDDQHGLYPTLLHPRFDLIQDQAHALSLYQTHLLGGQGSQTSPFVTAMNDVKNMEPFFLSPNAPGNAPVWLPGTGNNNSLVSNHMIPRFNGGPPVPMGAFVSPQTQHAPSHQVPFAPGVNPPTNELSNHKHTGKHCPRGSPVGASAENAPNFRINPSEAMSHPDGSNSARLSIYSVCT